MIISHVPHYHDTQVESTALFLGGVIGVLSDKIINIIMHRYLEILVSYVEQDISLFEFALLIAIFAFSFVICHSSLLISL